MSLLCIYHDSSIVQFSRWTEDALAMIANHRSFSVSQHSLQVQLPEADVCPNCRREGTSPLTSRMRWPASLTIEAAFAMTLFLFAVMSLLSFFFVIRTQIQVQTALEQTGNQLACLPEMASLATATVLFQEKLQVEQVDDSQIIGGSAGILLSKSTVMGHKPVIDLVATYRVKLPFFPEELMQLNVLQRSRKQAFGDAQFLAEEEPEYVYVTPSGEVYHESLYCTYIRPVTEEIAFSEVDTRRNRDGSKYYSCSVCCTGGTLVRVWITAWGERYHQSEHCRDIWHNVEQVSKSTVTERRPCSKCAAD